ncbi:MAG TPA: hypothetical protein VE863_05835, partial [Pyrinomonadaceae bacterium]|nr:hypothetical protein [Pyrinomonadaceae bacterium]
RSPKSVTVTMSSWGCQSGTWYNANCVTTPGATFQVPITLNIYAAGAPTPGGLILSKTQTFTLPYRPSSDNVNCPNYDSQHPGRWYQASTHTCFNGLASNITFDLTSFTGTLPNSVVFGVQYNSSHYGPNPIGDTQPCNSTTAGCPYDSLNVALSRSNPSVGSKPFLGTLYWDTFYGPNYCDLGANGTGFFRLDSPGNGCWYDTSPLVDPYVPAAQFVAYTIPNNKDQCKGDGWQSLARAGGSTFKNQGDCIQYVNTGK